MVELSCFKAYDIRGKIPEQLNESIAYRIGRAYGQLRKPKTVVVGGDVRATSAAFKHAVAEGLRDCGCNVIDIGMVGTEEVYFATWHLDADGGIEVTASHNPIDYNGMKLVGKHSKPISNDSGLLDIRKLVELDAFTSSNEVNRGQLKQVSVLNDYVKHLLTYINSEKLKPLKLVINSGNGAAGHVIDAIKQVFALQKLDIELITMHHEPDASFPNGIPNPLLFENRQVTSDAVIAHQADMGIAFDGDFDRCFLFDEKGRFIEGYYIVGLLAEVFLRHEPNAKIIHDPRLTYNTIDVVERAGGEAVMSKTGHAFIKERMRLEDAVYGGEMSAHHYFRDFAYCDSGMIPWLLVAELISTSGQSLSQLVDEAISRFPSSGEINRKLNDPDAAIAAILQKYESDALAVDRTDGISVEFGLWRFNLRKSNTEPVLRLNVESRGDITLMQDKTQELLSLLTQY